mgnify:FL=1
MYLDFFGLKELPFSIAPDPRYLYMSERHREALAHLLFGVNGQGGFVVLTGEVGTGKTTICRCFLNQVPANTDVAFIINPKLSARELMASICDELKIQYAPSASIKTLNDAINHYLLNAHSDGRHTVLIIDEAQNLRVDVLEQLRLLTNLETSEKKLLQIILLGQPELRDMLAQTDLRQLAQRVTARYHLSELSRVDVGAYVKCRLMVAGRSAQLFTNTAVTQLYKLSGGVPRLINLIADRSLLGAYAGHDEAIGPEQIKQAYREIQGETNRRAWFVPNRPGAVLGVMASVLLLGGLSTMSYFALNGDSAFGGIESVASQLPGSIISENSVVTESPSEHPYIEDFQDALTSSNDEVLAYQEALTPDIYAQNKAQENEQTLVKPSLQTEPVTTDDTPTFPFLDTLGDKLSSATSKFLAYQSIYKLWGVFYPEVPFMLACEYASLNDLGCLHKQGNWRSLLRLDRPAVLSLLNSEGEPLVIALLKIKGERARVALDGKAFWVTLDEIDRHWLGEYSVLWRLPPHASRTITPGQLDSEVWLRDQLKDIAFNKDFRRFNLVGRQESVSTLVKRFQKAVGLVPDGIAGSMTLIHINTILNSGSPSLLGKG